MNHYRKNHLYKVVQDRGYATLRSMNRLVGDCLGIGYDAAKEKCDGKTRWTFEESYVVATKLAMTPKEYCHVFLNDLFILTSEGHYICRVDDPDRILREKTERRRLEKAQKEMERLEREERIRQIEDIGI